MHPYIHHMVGFGAWFTGFYPVVEEDGGGSGAGLLMRPRCNRRYPTMIVQQE